MQPIHHHRRSSQKRQGSILLLVLVVVAVLTLGAYTFSDMMVSEVEATAMYGRQAESRAFADSGIELVAAMVSHPESTDDENIYHNPGRFQAVTIRSGETARGRGMFSILAPIETDPKAAGIRFGLIDECSKINLNAISSFGLDETASRLLLLYLPNMTEDIADAILDWLDEDDTPRLYGVESDYYESLSPPYKATNGGFKSLDELLQVAGVTPDLLYGEDANRNGLLDPNEDDGDASPPFDNQDGTLQVGWQAFLTLDSRESNLDSQGATKINVNDGLLTDLYEKLAEEFDEDIARFVVALRANGPRADPNAQSTDGTQSGNTTQGAATSTNRTGNNGNNRSGSSNSGSNNNSSSNNSSSSGNNSNRSNNNSNASSGRSSSGGSGSSSSNTSSGSSSGSSGSTQQPTQSELATGIQRLGNALGGGIQGAVTRGGIDLSQGSKYELTSLYDLIGVEVQTKVEGRDTVLQSPWTEDSKSMGEYLPILLDRLTTRRETEIQGRININQARYEVLLGIPNMTEDIAQAITESSLIGSDGNVKPEEMQARANTGWLVAQGIVDLPTMSKLDKYLTTKGTVFRAQVVGYFQQGGGFTRLEAVIDATKKPAKILTVRDLTDLGRGYPADLLSGTPANGNTP